MRWLDVIEGARPSGAPVGAELGPYPFLSGYGLVVRTSRLGVLMPPELSAMGLRNRETLDVLQATQTPRAPCRQLLEATGLAGTKVSAFWSAEAWSPVRLERAFDRCVLPVRQCGQCAAHGYHCALFQLPSIDACPWHGCPLTNLCRQCREPTWARFDAGGRIGRCACGFDPFDPRIASLDMWEFPTGAAEAWTTQYLDWAASERDRRWLVFPAAQREWSAGFAALAAPPRILQPPAPGLPIAQSFQGPGDDPGEREFWGWSLLGGERPLTFVPLPARLHGPLSDATQRAVARYPESTNAPLELVTLNGFEPDQTLRANVVNRPDCFIAPHGLSPEGTTWLNVSAIDPGATAFCGAVLDMAMCATGAEPELGDRSLQAARSIAVDRIVGRRHIAAALDAVLIQTYAQGLGAVLNVLVGRKAAIDLEWKVPVVELTVESEEIWAVRVVFVPAPGPKLKRVVDTPAPIKRQGVRKQRKRKRFSRGRSRPKDLQPSPRRRPF